jgi:alpha-L-rhamnosidase
MKKISLSLFLLFTLSGFQTLAQSKAYSLSQKYIVDPAYNANVYVPNQMVKDGTPWIYGYSEFESWRLHQMREDGKEAKLLVGYPGEYHEVFKEAIFSIGGATKKTIKEIRFFTDAAVSVEINGLVVYRSPATKAEQIITLKKATFVKTLIFKLNTDAEPPCLLIKDGPFQTLQNTWRWKAGNEPSQRPALFNQTLTGDYPHREQLPEIALDAKLTGSHLYDFGRELLGFIYLKSALKPVISAGESIPEALDTSIRFKEQSMEIEPVSQGLWRSKTPIAFRYVKVVSANETGIYCKAIFYPTMYKGAFACSDTLMTRVWMNSAYTLRLCRNDFLMDGVKRDRLPWAGDLAMSMEVNAFTFGDAKPVRQTLTVLNRAGIKNKDVNGIIDYSLWWIISEERYQLYYADAAHLTKEWPRIKETLDVLKSRSDSLGFLSPKNSWLFIDWVNTNKNSALQILWWWAQQSAVKLAGRMGDQATAEKWMARSENLKQQLLARAWSRSRSAWMDDFDHPGNISRHANILAVVSGLATKDQFPGIRNVLRDTTAKPVGTPYMGGFEAEALDLVGDSGGLIDYITGYWGGMLKQAGTTTFWESYNPAETGQAQFAFYGRPYAKSLCHAWSSGPAALLPSILLGIRPLSDGWRTFKVSPKPGRLQWISAAIPTPHGSIIVDIANKKMVLQVPAGTTADWDSKLYKGPIRVTRDIIE